MSHQTFAFTRVLCAIKSKGAKTGKYVVSQFLRLMVLKYFHDTPISGHLGAFKTWRKISHFYWPKLHGFSRCVRQTGAKCPGGVPHGDPVLSSWESFH